MFIDITGSKNKCLPGYCLKNPTSHLLTSKENVFNIKRILFFVIMYNNNNNFLWEALNPLKKSSLFKEGPPPPAANTTVRIISGWCLVSRLLGWYIFFFTLWHGFILQPQDRPHKGWRLVPGLSVHEHDAYDFIGRNEAKLQPKPLSLPDQRLQEVDLVTGWVINDTRTFPVSHPIQVGKEVFVSCKELGKTVVHLTVLLMHPLSKVTYQVRRPTRSSLLTPP